MYYYTGIFVRIHVSGAVLQQNCRTDELSCPRLDLFGLCDVVCGIINTHSPNTYTIIQFNGKENNARRMIGDIKGMFRITTTAVTINDVFTNSNTRAQWRRSSGCNNDVFIVSAAVTGCWLVLSIIKIYSTAVFGIIRFCLRCKIVFFLKGFSYSFLGSINSFKLACARYLDWKVVVNRKNC